jgi:hypothetical protein
MLDRLPAPVIGYELSAAAMPLTVCSDLFSRGIQYPYCSFVHMIEVGCQIIAVSSLSCVCPACLGILMTHEPCLLALSDTSMRAWVLSFIYSAATVGPPTPQFREQEAPPTPPGHDDFTDGLIAFHIGGVR